jgi:hypothetical protein
MAMSGFDPSSAAAVDDPAPNFDPSSASPVDTPDAGTPETAGRLARVAEHGLVGGVAGLPDTLDAIANPISHIVRGAIENKISGDDPSAPYAPQLSDFVHPAKWKEAAQYFADKHLGSAAPSNPTERIVNAGAEALPSAVLSPEAPILGGLSAVAGGAARQGAAEAGWSPGAQIAAGLAAGSIPSAASGIAQGARSMMRDSPEAVQGRISDAADSGTQLNAAQATGSGLLQKLASTSSRLWGGGPIDRAAKEQTENLGNHVQSIVDNLTATGTGAEASPTTAGEAINAGAAATKTNMQRAEEAAYAKRDSLIPPTTQADVSKSLATAGRLASPTSSEALNAAVASPKIAKFHEALKAAAPDGNLAYPDLAKLRSAVGANIDTGFAPANPGENGAFKALYGSLSDDMHAAASAVSPEAKQAADDASALYKSNIAQRESLDAIVNKEGGPEKVYAAATSGMNVKNGGPTVISRVMNATNPAQQNQVRATVLDKLGRPSAGGDFNASTFLTNWNRINGAAKDALFGTSGSPGQLRTGLDKFTGTLNTLKNSRALENPSGSGAAVGHEAGLFALLEAMGTPGKIVSGVGKIAAGVGGNNMVARALTSPKVVNWMAQTAKIPTSGLPNAVNQLKQMDDPSGQALAFQMQQPTPIARASGGKVDHEALVRRLIKRWKDAKKATDASTKPLLKSSDTAVAQALHVAQRAI